MEKELKELISKLSEKLEESYKAIFNDTIKELIESGEEITSDDVLTLFESIGNADNEIDSSSAKKAEAMMTSQDKVGFLDSLHKKFNNDAKTKDHEASHLKDIDMDDLGGKESKELEDHAKELNNAAKTKVKAAKLKVAPDSMKESKESCEAISKIFEGEEFSEDFKEKAQTIFEATFNAKVEAYHKQLDEAVAEILEEESIRMQEAYEDIIDKYLDYVVEQWLDDNILALESSLKVELADSVFDDIKNVLKENNIKIPEDKVDIVDEVVKENDELKESYNEAVSEIIALKESLKSFEKEKTVRELTEGLSELEKEEINKLFEGIEYSDKETFTRKSNILLEAFSQKSIKNDKVLAEDYEEHLEDSKESVKILKDSSDEVGMVLSAMKKTSRKQ